MTAACVRFLRNLAAVCRAAGRVAWAEAYDAAAEEAQRRIDDEPTPAVTCVHCGR